MFLRGSFLLGIAHQTDAQGDIVIFILSEMSPRLLKRPAGTKLDIPVSQSSPVADHEMISHPPGHVTDSAVKIIETPGIPGIGGTVMDDDIFPVLQLNTGLDLKMLVKIIIISQCYPQLLSFPETGRIFNPVDPGQFFDGHAVTAGDQPERVTLPDPIS